MSAKNILGALLVCLALGLAGGGIYAAHHLKRPKIDPDTSCPLAGPTGTTIIIIDKTDPLTSTEQALARQIITRERDALPPGAKLAVSILAQENAAADTVLKTVIALCNPGSEADPLFENAKRVSIRYEQAFLRPINEATQTFKGNGSAPTSPIALAVATAIENNGAAAGRNKLILISDLMEHTPQASAYNGSFGISALQQAIKAGERRWLRMAEMEIVLIPRPAYAARQNAAAAVWRQFLKELAGHDPAVLRP
jgi:hypothetical protein